MTHINNKEILNKYAQLIVKVGVNIKQGQDVILNCNVEAKDLAREITKEAYKLKARYVQVNYTDEEISMLHYKYRDVEDLCDIKQWQIDSKIPYIRNKACLISIISPYPGIYKDIDNKKISQVNMANHIALKEMYDATMNNRNEWTIAAYPNAIWAKEVFNNDDETQALLKLNNAILNSCHLLEDGDIEDIWNKHNELLHKRAKVLNDYNFTYLRFVSKDNDTDLKVGLVKKHIWCGGKEKSVDDHYFNPNLPSEEIFTMPDKYNVNGRVSSSKPLDYNGKIIKDFYLVFKDGRVIEYDAKENKDALKSLIEFDEGSSYLGEVALVQYNSNISMMDILFKNTLFDENASCHLALGSSYPMNVENGINMNEDELKNINANMSKTHVDFMFGTKDMSIIGVSDDNLEVNIFINGNFVI